MSIIGKLYILTLFFVVIFNIEFFPFSNYQMYSNSFLPKKYFDLISIYEVDADGGETVFKNNSYKIFHGYQPLLQSITNNLRAGKSQDKIARSIFEVVKRNNHNVKGLRFYKTKVDWENFKNQKLGVADNKTEVLSKELMYEYFE